MCSNAASVSSPDEGRGCLWKRCRVGKAQRAHHVGSIKKWWARRKRAFAHPHMRAFESSIPTGGWVCFFAFGVEAARGAMRSAACRRGRGAQGLASGDLCSISLHHLISGRTALVRTHIPHACGEEAMMMGPIYETACLLAQGWHGHHPSRGSPRQMPRHRRVG